MNNTDDNAPATKKDLRLLREELIGNSKSTEKGIRGDMTKMEKGIRGDMAKMEKGIRGDMHTMKEEICRYFDVVYEDMRHDLLGVNKDEISVINDRSKSNQRRISYIEKTLHLST